MQQLLLLTQLGQGLLKMLNASQLRAALTALLMQLQLGLLRGNLRLPELRLHLDKSAHTPAAGADR